MKQLTVKQMMQICEEASARKRNKLMVTLTDAGADVEMRVRELKEHDRYHGNIGDLFDFIQTPLGAARALELAGVSCDELDPHRLIVDACSVCGWDLGELNRKAAVAADPTSSPNQSPETG